MKYEELASTLSDDARALADAACLSELDWSEGTYMLSEVLWTLCEVLRGYESPSWGNTGGRYGHVGGWLDLDALLAAADEELEDLDRWDPVRYPDVAQAFVRHAEEHGEGALVELADAVQEAIVKVRPEYLSE